MSNIMPVSYIRRLELPESQMQADYFGFSIPFLPDFLNDHTLLGQTSVEKLREVFGRFERFILGLRKYKNSAFSLRFISHPEKGAIDIFIVGRLLTKIGESAQVAQQVAFDLGLHFPSFNLPIKPLAAQPDTGTYSLQEVCRPFSSPYNIVEIRQHERIVPLMTVDQEAYVIHPLWGPSGSLLEPFETMLHLDHSVALTIYLEPTVISELEYKTYAEAAYLAQTVADLDLPVQSSTAIRRRKDPGAEIVGKIYSAFLQSLTESFIFVAQVASQSANCAWTVSRSFASSLTSSTNNNEGFSGSSEALPSNTDIVVPRTGSDLQRATQTFEHLLWLPWGDTLASENKIRMKYLVGSKAAATAFRYPISVKGGIPGIRVIQSAPDFAPGPRPEKAGSNEIHLGSYQKGGAAVIDVKDLTRHALITGFTGSGKTNTVLYLLDQVWKNHHIPFLVIEAAKKEYRALMNVEGFEDLIIFSLGDETTSPFRLNPFELLNGVRLEAHLGRLQACFDAALPQFGILPSIISEAMEKIFREKNWRLTDVKMPDDTRIFPTMRDMFKQVIRVAEERGYAGETFHNIRAAAAGRIGSLLTGSKGRMFGGKCSFPAEVIFNRPVILELNDLNQDDKALTMMFILTWLREYREQHKSNALNHVTVVEEAHNVLSNITSVGASEVSADTKAKAVAAFSDMLSEVRAYGEGLIISDQSPEKLAPDAVRNTNLQISHQLRDKLDREAISRAMIMDDLQQDYLGKLRIGQAAFFKTGIEKATFITVPEFKDSRGFNKVPNDQEVHDFMKPFNEKHFRSVLPFSGCEFCSCPCKYREPIEPLTLDREIHEKFMEAVKRFDDFPEPEAWPDNWKSVASVCIEAVARGGYIENLDAAYCYFSHEIDFPFTKHMRTSFEKSYQERIRG